MIEVITLYGEGGSYTVQDPQLAFVTPLVVARSGRVYTKVSGTPSDLEFKHDASAGSIEFSTPFYGDTTSFMTLEQFEKVTVKYKT
jgi:hypothetical protein